MELREELDVKWEKMEEIQFSIALLFSEDRGERERERKFNLHRFERACQLDGFFNV